MDLPGCGVDQKCGDYFTTYNMYKPGQILTVGDRQYRITKCERFKGCVMCKTENSIIPCITHAALSGGKFSMNVCWSNVPRDCYPKEENPSVSGK